LQLKMLQLYIGLDLNLLYECLIDRIAKYC
jgi:hypothetical protein